MQRLQGGARESISWYQGYSNEELFESVPLDWRVINTTSGIISRSCLTPQCIMHELDGRSIMFAGDSTHRAVYDALVGLLASRYHAYHQRFGPTINGTLTADASMAKAQGDSDTVVMLPTDTGSGWKARFTLSFRFLRGLDTFKLMRNIQRPQKLYFYPEWKQRKLNTPTHALLSGDVNSNPQEKSTALSAVVLHSCAWDLPRYNRSTYYYPTSMCNHSCAKRCEAAVRLETGAYGIARLHGGICKLRGEGLSDDQIYEGFEHELEMTLGQLKQQLQKQGTRLLVRGCHSGTVSGASSSGLRESLRQMDAIIKRVASKQCIPIIDVWELDRHAGFYSGITDDIHVPEIGSFQAALATLLALTVLES